MNPADMKLVELRAAADGLEKEIVEAKQRLAFLELELATALAAIDMAADAIQRQTYELPVETFETESMTDEPRTDGLPELPPDWNLDQEFEDRINGGLDIVDGSDDYGG